MLFSIILNSMSILADLVLFLLITLGVFFLASILIVIKNKRRLKLITKAHEDIFLHSQEDLNLFLLRTIRYEEVKYLSSIKDHNHVIISPYKEDLDHLAYFIGIERFNKCFYFDLSLYYPSNKLDEIFFDILNLLGIHIWDDIFIYTLLERINFHFDIVDSFSRTNLNIDYFLNELILKCNNNNIGIIFLNIDKASINASNRLFLSLFTHLNSIICTAIELYSPNNYFELIEENSIPYVVRPLDYFSFSYFLGKNLFDLTYMGYEYNKILFHNTELGEFVDLLVDASNLPLFDHLYRLTANDKERIHQIRDDYFVQYEQLSLLDDDILIDK